jgi:hypothetical protein
MTRVHTTSVSTLRHLVFALVAIAPAASAYLSDGNIYTPVNYSTLVPPGVGQAYLDPTFGTAVKRVSDARNTKHGADAGNLPYVVHEYSTMSPFNADNSRMLVLHHSYFALYGGQGNYIKDLPLEVSSSSEPRWSRQAPNIFYYLSGNALKRYDVATDVSALVRTFSEYARITARGESELSYDGDHLALVGDDVYVFVYTLSTDTKGPVLDTSVSSGFDNVYITPDNNVLIGYRSGSARYNGLELYDQNMNFLRQVTSVIGHMDVARDITGEEIILWANADDFPQAADCQNAIVKIRLADGARTCLISFDWTLALHVSAADNGEWFVVSTYSSLDPAPVPRPTGTWSRYTNEILLVRLNGAEQRRLAHHRSRPVNSYYYQPRASISRDGRLIVFSSNYGLSAMLGYPTDYSDVYLIDLAGAEPAFAGSTDVPAARIEQDAASVTRSGPWQTNLSARHSAGSATLSTAAGARLDFAFSGTGVSWIGFGDAWSGIAQLYLDEAFISAIDTYAASESAQARLYTLDGLAPGAHTLTVEATGNSSPPSAGAWVWVDAFDVTNRIEQATAGANYTGAWYHYSHPAPSGGSIATAMNPGDRVEFSFTGSAVSWIGLTDRWSGIARVYIDGVQRADIDTYSPVDQVQARVYTLSGLPPAAHTLAIEVTGRKHPASSGHWLWVDAFDVVP